MLEQASRQRRATIADHSLLSENGHADLSWWKVPEFWLPIASLLVFALLTTANVGYARSGGAEVFDEGVTSNPIRQAAFIGLGVVPFVLGFVAKSRPRNSSVAWVILLPIMATVGILFLSVLWSDSQNTTVKRAITALIVSFVGISVGQFWNTRMFARGLLLFSLLFLTLSIVAELRYRSFLHVDEYRFSGLIHPIRQSSNCVCLLLSSLVLYVTDRRRIFLILMSIAVLFLLFTKARTGVVAGGLAFIWIIAQVTPVRLWILSGFMVLGIVIAGLLVYQATSGRSAELSKLTAMGRDEEQADPTKLTGRIDIWKIVIPDMLQRPILGYGYGAYWNESRWTKFERATGWPLYHSHSTYFEVILGVGLLGLLLGGIALSFSFYHSHILAQSGDSCALLTGGLIIMGIVSGVTDVSLLNLEFESVLMMTSIGVMIFASPEVQRSSK
jgi:exopolysaccharide production protein ExoQ